MSELHEREAADPVPGQNTAAPGLRPKALLFALVLFAAVLLFSGCDYLFNSPNCQCMMSACSQLLNLSVQDPVYDSQAAAVDNQIHFFIELNATGIFTPTNRASDLFALLAGQPSLASAADDLAAKGYVAIRVPHAPPTYPLSTLLPGIPPWEPNAVQVASYSPRGAVTQTITIITVTRRLDLEPAVNLRYPISDGHSHWEVWWLPQGNKFPLPTAPFELGKKRPMDYDTLRIRFRLDFGPGVSALSCAGCPLQILFFDGRRFVGPFDQAIHFADEPVPPPSNPSVAFGPHCGQMPLAQMITPTVRFTHTLGLENWDFTSRTYTITTSSTEGWPYRYYYAAGTGGPLLPTPEMPFTVTVGPGATSAPGCYRLMAVYTPTLAMPLTTSEEFIITATSRLSPTIRAVGYSLALGPDIDRTVGGAFRLYLPVILSNYSQ